MRRAGGEWDGFSAQPIAFHDAGNVVTVEGRYRGSFKASGRPLDAQFCHVWTVRDGKVATFRQYVDTAAAPGRRSRLSSGFQNRKEAPG